MEATMTISEDDGTTLHLFYESGEPLCLRIDEGEWFTLDPDRCADLLKFIAAFGGED